LPACEFDATLTALPAPGNLRWRIALRNTGAAACSLVSFDFPALPARQAPPGPFGTIGQWPSPGSTDPLTFESAALTAVSVVGAPPACTLRALDEQPGKSLHCGAIELRPQSSITIDVWTAALAAPPHRYCATGGIVLSDRARSIGDCADVYRDAVAPHGLVIEGPIVGQSRLPGVRSFEWIGGNYTNEDLVDVSVTFTPPPGVQLSGIGNGAWDCSVVFGDAGERWTCTTARLAAGEKFSIEQIERGGPLIGF
jgi:hypothetical protein